MKMKKMIITFLTANNFSKINGKEFWFDAGFGTGRNVTAIKKDETGRIFAKLSSIANPIYDGISKEINNERIINQINRTLTYYTR